MRWFLTIWLACAGTAHAQTVDSLDGVFTRHDSAAAWRAFLAGAERGSWRAFEAGFELNVVVTEAGLWWQLVSPEGEVLAEGEATDVSYNGEPQHEGLPVVFACMGDKWVPYLRLPTGRWLSLAPWMDVPEWDFTFDCDPHEGAGGPHPVFNR